MPDSDLLRTARTGPLAELPPPVVEHIVRAASIFRAKAGERIYHPGAHAGMHVVITGLVRVAMSSTEGRQVTIRYARSGEILGAPIVVSREGVPVSVQAVTNAKLARTPPNLLWTLAQNDVRVALWLAKELSVRVRGLLDELADNAFLPVRARIARHLLDLAADSQVCAELHVRASHQQLADSVGTVREVVARTLARLKRDGVVTTERDRICILDPQTLAAVGGERR